jgi:hypothetical protein
LARARDDRFGRARREAAACIEEHGKKRNLVSELRVHPLCGEDTMSLSRNRAVEG